MAHYMPYTWMIYIYMMYRYGTDGINGIYTYIIYHIYMDNMRFQPNDVSNRKSPEGPPALLNETPLRSFK